MSENVKKLNVSYGGYVWAACNHALVMMVRRHRAILAAALALVPVLMPLALAFLSDAQFGEDGSKVFSGMVRYLYIEAITPLFALFFACMLIGEDVESQTITYLLTRPIPRSALVIGKYLAFLIVSICIMAPSIALTFAACTALGGISFSVPDLILLMEYIGVAVLALVGYGSLCMLFGALFKRPIIAGIVVIFGWQRLATFVPGLIDFFTISKYVGLLLSKIGGMRITATVNNSALVAFQKKEVLITASKAGTALVLIAFVLLAVTTFVVRRREYTAARALGG
jgi:ABC-type transport system involved in multi-copper enzyme maturation permease subunit